MPLRDAYAYISDGRGRKRNAPCNGYHCAMENRPTVRPAPPVDPGLIEISLRRLEQFFNSFDPSPFYMKDLDVHAESYLLSWVQDVPHKVPLRLRLYLESAPSDAAAAAQAAADVTHAVRTHFQERARLTRFERRQLLAIGRVSLLIGIVFTAFCLGSARFLSDRLSGFAGQVSVESLTILAWVAMWRPLQIYLYDWWPLRAREKNFLRMSRMPVEIVPPGDQTPSHPSR
jgi:hypothetical protein